MTLTRVQAGSKANTGSVTSDTIVLNGVTAGNMLFVAFRFGIAGGAVLSVSDNNGNTWVKEDTSTAGGTRTFSVFRAYNVNSGNTTITLSESGQSANSLHAVAIEFSGELTSADPFDSNITSRAANGSSTSPSVTASGTTGQANETLIVAVDVGGTGTPFTAGSGYTFNTADTNTGNNTSPRVAVEIKGLTSTTASPVGNGTIGTSTTWDIIIGAYAEASSGTTPSDTDSATLTDTANQIGVGGPSDSSSVSESGAIGLGNTDAATLAEQNAIALRTSDSAAFAEQVAIAVTTSTSDTASATESASIGASVSTSDTAALAESIKLALGATDSAHLGEAMALALAHQDSATLQELVSVALAIADAASLTESASVTQNGGNTPSASDSATLTDTAVATARISTSDIGTLAEQAAIALKVTDVASMTEQLGLGLIAVDSAALVEQLQLAVANAGSDAGALGELQSVVASVLAAAEAVSMADTARVSQNGVSSTALKIFLVGVRPLTLEAPTRAFTFTLPHAFTFTLPTP